MAIAFGLTGLPPPLAGGSPTIVVPLLADTYLISWFTPQIHAITTLSGPFHYYV